jgi:hypothetical protein
VPDPRPAATPSPSEPQPRFELIPPAPAEQRNHRGSRQKAQASVLLLAVFSAIAVGEDKPRAPFGIRARPSVLALMSEVEQDFGHPIVELISESSEQNFGSFNVDRGVPTITLAKDDLTESNLVHELMHLKLMAQGYPRIEWEPPPPQEIAGEVYGTRSRVRDPIEHFMFRPSIKALGVAADPEDVGVLVRYVHENEHPKENQSASILRFFFLMLSVEDRSLRNQLLASYKRDGLRAEARIGARMVSQVEKFRPTTPQEEINCFLACVNILWKGERKATFASWSSERLGNTSNNIVTAHLTLQMTQQRMVRREEK